jgi:hypothetical protein
MTIELEQIDLSTPNSGNGTNLRAGGQRINANFTKVGEAINRLAAVLPDAGVVYNVEAADAERYRYLSDAAAKTINVRLQANHTLPENYQQHFDNDGAGLATFVAEVGVTIKPPKGGTLILEQGDVVTLKRLGENVFRLIGSTKAAA